MITGCQTIYAPDDRPARIRAGDETSHAALNRAVDDVMGIHVTLAPTALTDSSYLTLDSGPSPSMENPVPVGREYREPISLQLVTDGEDCFLIDSRNNNRHLADSVSCEPE